MTPEQMAEIPDLVFGKDGKPFYIDGPYDDSPKILKTLEKSVGKGNFDFMVQAVPGMGGGLNFLK